MAQKQNHPQSPLWSKLRPVAQQMREEPTEAEQILWERLRNRGLNGYKFRRQHAIDRFIVDFYCREAALIIEIDGPIHEKQVEEDRERQEVLTRMGFHFLHITNDQVYHELQTVTAQILRELETLTPK